ncbi:MULTISPECIES: tRNA-dihydrouridine synthase [unclassified Chelatococcus]|uniref:oxidoreductase n=1 Tax=unclassified Chelatococcus TaxID=2638111 RepID=UPI001BCE0CE8|nr:MULTISPECIES: tRNA-dihydrouridine synthase [unclassified Chelatococcus]CAH1652629.1 NADPH dehydrogenase [Hyphomicrobiales bacterium]MBS7740011.1 tRNA-dihydrouridine synthase [Chelatococcus sp. HY11]MBX3546980.1 tRNA-dihydrouridine synthase [Chelatococcus sp.]MCO5078689.1 tRNA-dihydrouridine synthase [Chelatococcus sp.]CAH1685934.1 NADPH dehydrogenase [Hyphomicrobiales bacterium]
MSLASTPFAIGGLTLKNRIVMPPMQQYQGTAEAFATAYHVHHYARRARGGVGLVIIESTAVAPEGRLMADDIGLFSEAHVAPVAAIAAAVKAEGVPIFMQLSHGGRKSRPHPGSRLIAPSAIPHDDDYGMPEAMSLDDITCVVMAFAKAARRALSAGFNGLELHAAHGYLLHQFLSPLSNTRGDAYGGDLEGRSRIVADVIRAVREAVGRDVPVTIRVSASDYQEGGLTAEMIAEALTVLIPLGLDAVHVSSGGLSPEPPPNTGPGYQLGFARTIRERIEVPVIAVGNIRTAVQVEDILREGHADLVAIGRPLLVHPDLGRVL